MFLLIKVEYIAKKLPPIFVSPWTQPIPINIYFFELKKIFLNEENLLLLRISIEENINKKATIILKSKKCLNFNAKTKNKIKNGKQNKLYSLIKLRSLTLDLKNWRALIVIETGINIFMVFAKSYPRSKNDGVPNNNRPIPKMDWIAIKERIIIISKKVIILRCVYNT